MTRPLSSLESKRCFGHRTSVSAVGWNLDGSRLLGAGDCAGVLIFDTARLEASNYPEQRCLYDCRGHTKTITSLICSPTSPEMFATTGMDQLLNVYDMRVGTRPVHFFTLSSRCLFADWSPDGNTIAVGLASNIVTFVDCLSWKEKSDRKLSFDSNVNQFRWTPDGKRMVFGRGDGSVDIYNWPSLKFSLSFRGNVCASVAVAVDPLARFFAIASLDTTVSVWDSHTITNMFTIDRWEVPLQQVEYSSDGQYLAVIGEFERIDISDAVTGSHVQSINSPSVLVDLAWHPTRNLLAYSPVKHSRDRYNQSENGPPICVWGFARTK